jgi:hypothetical protein
MNIYVSNLSFDVQDEDLKNFFTPYGEVTSAKIINDKETGRSRGFGFAIKVMEAKPKEDRPARSGGSYKSSSPFKNDRNKW